MENIGKNTDTNIEKTPEKTLYCIHLQDYATPSYYSGEKPYIGTKEEILNIISILEKKAEGYPYGPHPTCKVARDFFNNQGDGMGSVFGEAPHQIIYPVKILGEYTTETGVTDWDHLNVWDCVYKMHAKSIKTHAIYTQIKGFKGETRNVRVIKAEFTGLGYTDEFSANKISIINCKNNWGHPGIMVKTKDGVVTNTLYIIDMCFDDYANMYQDMIGIKTLDYKPVIDDIFGDG